MSQKNSLYFIALIAPVDIRKDVEAFKKEVKEKYKARHALKLPAHITLQIPFRMDEKKERILVKELQKFAETQENFVVGLDGFGKFSRNVIFVKVVDHEPVKKLYEQLQKLIRKNLELKEHEKTEKIHPHLTIASRDLDRKLFPEAWADFKDCEYKAEFPVQNLRLLKHNGKTWDNFRKFNFRK